ncbi:MAG: histidine kinase [Dehalobacterium sp.]
MGNDLTEVIQLEDKLEKLQKELANLKNRWPAHSVKLAMILELEKLEEKIAQINNTLKEKRK